MSYAFNGREIQTLLIDGDPWFVAKDVAEVLRYTDTDQAIRKHCKSATTCPVESTGQLRNVKVIPERDVYRLVFRSRLAAAEQFEDWVVSVLPSIRRRGAYIQGQGAINPQLLDGLAETIRSKALPALREYDRQTEHLHWLALQRPHEYQARLEATIDGIALGFDLPRSVVCLLTQQGLAAVADKEGIA